MNAEQRKKIEIVLDQLETAKIIVDEISCQEQEKFENLSEGLQQTEANQKLEENASVFDGLKDKIEEIINGLEEYL
ncbi:MAG: hypothetical protein EOP42_31020 [Sphingobacteriaceae bacterium]|nr:MAG: hypothetical protein EOP42_31020 [Sphingobacteriaceae bacterium]